LLAALPPDDYARLLPQLETIPLVFKQVLHKQGAPIERVFFPSGGMCSLMHTMADGRAVEVGTVGAEGAVNIGVLFGGFRQPYEVVVQVPADGATAQSISIAHLQRALDARGALYDLMNRYAQAFMVMSTQSTACNGLHTVEERCARWLLMCHDRAGSDTFMLTHEFLAVMLGVRRATVTLVVGELQRAGLVQARRRGISVLSRGRLEAAACECYRVVRGYFDEILPSSS
jgi:CRP-like cAMP-binding protein